MMTDARDLKNQLVKKVALSSGVSPDQAEAVLKSLGLEDLVDRVRSVTGNSFQIDKVKGVQVSLHYDKSMIAK